MITAIPNATTPSPIQTTPATEMVENATVLAAGFKAWMFSSPPASKAMMARAKTSLRMRIKKQSGQVVVVYTLATKII